MRAFILFSCMTLALACSSKNETSPDEADSLDVDSVMIEAEPKTDTTLATADESESISTAIAELIDAQALQQNGYTLQLSASGYEYMTEATWSFDSLFNLTACSQRWASEGLEGQSSYFFRVEKLYAYCENDGYDSRNEIKLFHKQLGGISYTESDGVTVDSTLRALDLKTIPQTEADLKKQLQDIVNTLRDNEDKISGDDDALALHLENEVNYGEETMTETSEISLSKKLLTKLLE